MRLSREQIASLIPHAGRMVLLDEVIEWDENRIVCQTRTHQDRGNPLAVGGELSSVCGIELAAQAMAVHGGLVATTASDVSAAPETKPRAGFLASVRNVRMEVLRLDDILEALTIEAVREAGDERNVLYRFEVRAGSTPLVSGRAAVMLQMPEAREGAPA